MFFEIQDFDFAQIQSNLPKSNHFFPNSPHLSRFHAPFWQSYILVYLF